ncbi:hypothetical protein CR513_21102, partial [Mucuna pruriens]
MVEDIGNYSPQLNIPSYYEMRVSLLKKGLECKHTKLLKSYEEGLVNYKHWERYLSFLVDLFRRLEQKCCANWYKQQKNDVVYTLKAIRPFVHMLKRP